MSTYSTSMSNDEFEEEYKQALSVIYNKKMFDFAHIDDNYFENINKNVVFGKTIKYKKYPHSFEVDSDAFDSENDIKDETIIEKEISLSEMKTDIINRVSILREEVDGMMEQYEKDNSLVDNLDNLNETGNLYNSLVYEIFDIYIDTKLVKILQKKIVFCKCAKELRSRNR